jgi:hypothetical protein
MMILEDLRIGDVWQFGSKGRKSAIVHEDLPGAERSQIDRAERSHWQDREGAHRSQRTFPGAERSHWQDGESAGRSQVARAERSQFAP